MIPYLLVFDLFISDLPKNPKKIQEVIESAEEICNKKKNFSKEDYKVKIENIKVSQDSFGGLMTITVRCP